MKNDPSWPVYAVPLAAAAVSVIGTVYVGWRQRRLTRALAEFQAGVADKVFRRQLYLTFSSRAHIVVSRASEVGRAITALAQLEPQMRQRKLEQRTERLDRACDDFFEAWSELLSGEMAPLKLVHLVEGFSDEMEAARLRMLIDDVRDAGILKGVVDAAKSCQRESSALLAGLRR